MDEAAMTYNKFKKLVTERTGIEFRYKYLYAKFEAFMDFRIDPYDIKWSACTSEAAFSREFRRLLDKKSETWDFFIEDDECEN